MISAGRALLPFQARHTANGSLGSEKAASGRAAASFRDRILDEIGDPEDLSGDVFIDKHVQWDLTASDALHKSVRVFGAISHLNNRPLYSYQGARNAAS